MDVRVKLVQMRFHLIFAALAILILAALFYMAPSIVTLVSYFWPLLLSTALFLAAVIVFGRISPPASDTAVESKAGEHLLDYVALAGPPVVAEIGVPEEEEEGEGEKDAMKSQ